MHHLVNFVAMGTIVNVLAVIAGSLLGILFHRKLPEKFLNSIFHIFGLFTVFMGIYLAFKTRHMLWMLLSLVIGLLIGEVLQLEQRFERGLEQIKFKLGLKESRFSQGAFTAFMLFCMGSMTILGAFEEGMGGYPELLYLKSLMDGISSIALAAAFGWGVMFSSVPLLAYQGGLTVLAFFIGAFIPQEVINEISATGGLLLLGLGLNILNLKKISVMNMLPALLIIALLVYFFPSI